MFLVLEEEVLCVDARQTSDVFFLLLNCVDFGVVNGGDVNTKFFECSKHGHFSFSHLDFGEEQSAIGGRKQQEPKIKIQLYLFVEKTRRKRKHGRAGGICAFSISNNLY